jgi:hypothetical protein
MCLSDRLMLDIHSPKHPSGGGREGGRDKKTCEYVLLCSVPIDLNELLTSIDDTIPMEKQTIQHAKKETYSKCDNWHFIHFIRAFLCTNLKSSEINNECDRERSQTLRIGELKHTLLLMVCIYYLCDKLDFVCCALWQ